MHACLLAGAAGACAWVLPACQPAHGTRAAQAMIWQARARGRAQERVAHAAHGAVQSQPWPGRQSSVVLLHMAWPLHCNDILTSRHHHTASITATLAHTEQERRLLPGARDWTRWSAPRRAIVGHAAAQTQYNIAVCIPASSIRNSSTSR